MTAYDVVIVGGGLSGIACAVKLAQNGKSVLLCEKQPVLGGRLSGWPTCLSSGEVVSMQHGYHAVFPEYKECTALLEAAGISLVDEDEYLIWHRQRWVGFRTVHGNALRKLFAMYRLRLFFLRHCNRKLLRFVFDCIWLPSNIARSYNEPFAKFCARARLPDDLAMLLMGITRTLFHRPDEILTCTVVRAVHFYLFKHRDGLRPRTFLETHDIVSVLLHAHCCKAGVKTLLSERVIDVKRKGNELVIATDNDAFTSRRVVFALDRPSLMALCRIDSEHVVSRANHAYVNVRLWCVASIPATVPTVFTLTGSGTLDCVYLCHRREPDAVNWSNDVPGGAVIELHSYSTKIANVDAVIEAMLADVEAHFHVQQIKHREIIMGQNPSLSPLTTPKVEGTFYAGDWTQTDCFLMEAAVRSGHKVAEQIIGMKANA